MSLDVAVLVRVVEALVALMGQSETFVHVEGAVNRWEAKQLSGLEKKTGVVNELKIIGVHASAWIVDTLIQLAVLKIKTASAQSTTYSTTAP